MALTGLIGNGTYTRIENISYNRIDKYLGIIITTYLDSNKSIKLSTFNIDIKVDTPQEVESMLSAPPESPNVSQFYLVGPNPTGDWVGKSGVVGWNGLAWTDNPSVSVLAKDSGIIYDKNGTEWLPSKTKLSEAAWLAAFDTPAISGVNNNIIKKCYDYLKTLPEFANAQDC